MMKHYTLEEMEKGVQSFASPGLVRKAQKTLQAYKKDLAESKVLSEAEVLGKYGNKLSGIEQSITSTYKMQKRYQIEKALDRIDINIDKLLEKCEEKVYTSRMNELDRWFDRLKQKIEEYRELM